MTERQIYLAEDLKRSLEGEIWDELDRAYQSGRLSEEEVEQAYLDWQDQHRTAIP